MKISRLISPLILAAIPITASAAGLEQVADDPISTTFTFGYSSGDIDGDIDLSTMTFDVDSDISLGSNINIALGLSISKTTVEDLLGPGGDGRVGKLVEI